MQEARQLLKWLLWLQSQESRAFLTTLINHVKKARPEDICDCVEVLLSWAFMYVQCGLGAEEYVLCHSGHATACARVHVYFSRTIHRRVTFSSTRWSGLSCDRWLRWRRCSPYSGLYILHWSSTCSLL